MDEKTRAALARRVAEARDASMHDVPWEFDVGTFEHGAKKAFSENFNAGEYASAPFVPGFSSAERLYDSEEAFLERHRRFLMQHGGIASDAQFDSVKRETLEAFSRYKALYEKQRERNGESPYEGDFLAERASLIASVDSVSETNPLFDFARRAAETLDGNAGWSYARKMAALRFLANKAGRYELARDLDDDGAARETAKE